MRTVLIIFAVFALLGTSLGAALLTARNLNEASSLHEIDDAGGLVGGLTRGLMQTMVKGEIPSPGAFYLGMGLSLFTALIAIFGIVAAFMKNPKIGLIAAMMLALISGLLILLQPSLDTGSLGPANPKTVALIVGIMGIVGAALIYGVHKIPRVSDTVSE